jgi:hypothetical protein
MQLRIGVAHWSSQGICPVEGNSSSADSSPLSSCQLLGLAAIRPFDAGAGEANASGIDDC